VKREEMGKMGKMGKISHLSYLLLPPPEATMR
jgi:hypothetical protein